MSGGGDPSQPRSGEHSQLGESQKERKEKVMRASGRSRPTFCQRDVSWSSTQENKGEPRLSSASRANNKKEPRCLETVLVASGLPDGGMMKRAETAA